MKNLFLLPLLILFVIPVFSQDEMTDDQTGLPGDNFSLEGALDLFQKAESIEAFEQLINTESNHVNNLDLDDDGNIDYVKVVSKQDGDVHIFILQVAVSDSENQDIAVIELEKTKDTEAIIQIIGDEEIYGDQIIIEPSDGSESDDDDQEVESKGPAAFYSHSSAIIVNVWAWPSVRFVYAPAYRPWVSPWRWRVYPTWYRPWRPLTWSVWHPFRANHFRPGWRAVHTHRAVRAHRIYTPIRVRSNTVHTRYRGAHANYKVTRTKTKVTGPRGNSMTKKTTTVRGQHGHIKAQRTTVKKGRR